MGKEILKENNLVSLNPKGKTVNLADVPKVENRENNEDKGLGGLKKDWVVRYSDFFEENDDLEINEDTFGPVID